MQFVRVAELSEGVEPLRTRLARDLTSGKHVLWLLSGGSNIQLSVAVMSQIPNELTTSLTVTLMDERYGQPGHADSNDQKLAAAGFDPAQARWIHLLQPNLSLSDTSKLFASQASAAFQRADVIIGQFGMGTDGHVAGILPDSPAVSSADFAASFVWSDFQRITLTPGALMGVSTAYLFAAGADKLDQLQRLQDSDLSLDEQPAQILKQLPEAYVYNDQIGNNMKEVET